MTRQSIIENIRAKRDEVRQLFTDAAHWNENVRKPHEPEIDPDPDGTMREIERAYTATLEREEPCVKKVPLLHGDIVESYGPFHGLIFLEEEGGHVRMMDRAGNEKRVYTSLFLRHAKFGSRTEPKFDSVGCSQCGRDFGPADHGFSHCEDHGENAKDQAAP